MPFARALGPDDFESSLAWVDYCIVTPGSMIGVHQHVGDEEVYLILAGEGLMVMNGEERHVTAGDATLLKSGGSHGLRNRSTETDLTVLVVDNRIRDGEAARSEGTAFYGTIHNLPMRTINAHDGIGEIQVGDIFDRAVLHGHWDWIEYLTMPPGTTIGYHQHVGNEEFYFVLAGEGVLTLNGKEHPVGPGHLSLVKSGGWHGLRNTGDEEIKILVVQVRVRRPEADTRGELR